MKKEKKLPTARCLAAAIACGMKRFEVHRENSKGTHILAQATNSEAEAAEAFMKQAPSFEGGEINLIDKHEQRLIAFAKWRLATTEIGLPILERENVFHDWHLALLACQVRMQTSEVVQLTA